MILAEVHIFKPTNKLYKELDHLCFLSKNLYNATLYHARQSFFAKSYKNYDKLNREFTHNNQPDYRALPAKVAKHTQKLVDKNFASFFALLKKKKKNEYDEKVRIPKYLDKTKGRQVVCYEKGAISKKELDKGYLSLSGTGFKIKTKVTRKNIQAARITPCNGYIKVEVLYNHVEEPVNENDNISSVDLGVNNLMTVAFTNRKPIIINGRPLKSLNQYYNKNKAKCQIMLEVCNDKHNSRRLQRLSVKRRNRINDYLHKATTFLVNQLVSNNISMLVIGYNEGWKQDVRNGKKNNQNFVTIPHLTLVEMLEYKCQKAGILCVRNEESYTSKSSFLDKDILPSYSKDNKEKYKFQGKRKKRGLYVSKEGTKINADVNGAYNIMRKVVGERIYDLVDPIVVCSTPHQYTFGRSGKVIR